MTDWSDIEVAAPTGAAEVERTEQALADAARGLDAARTLADLILEVAPHPVSVRIESPTRCVLHLSEDGTNRLNETAVQRKAATVLALDHSTLWWHEILTARGTTPEAHPFADSGLFTDVAGGFPLRLGGQLVGAVAVSGLAPLEDHALVVHALASLGG